MTARRDLAFPLRKNGSARPADADEHLRDMMLQVLFTLPGERVELPEFGAGMQRLVFTPLSAEAAHVAQFTAQAQLQRWLGHRLQLEGVRVMAVDSRLVIEVSYVHGGTDVARTARFSL